MVTLPPPHGCVSTDIAEVSARRSAVAPLGGGAVVMSMMRKRRRVTAPAVVLVNLRRIESVPCGPFVTGVKSRMRFGAAELATQVATSEALTAALRWMGLVRFSGPGAPSRCPAVVEVFAVST